MAGSWEGVAIVEEARITAARIATEAEATRFRVEEEAYARLLLIGQREKAQLEAAGKQAAAIVARARAAAARIGSDEARSARLAAEAQVQANTAHATPKGTAVVRRTMSSETSYQHWRDTVAITCTGSLGVKFAANKLFLRSDQLHDQYSTLIKELEPLPGGGSGPVAQHEGQVGPGYFVVSINESDVIGLSSQQVTARLRSLPTGSPVELGFREFKEVSAERRQELSVSISEIVAADEAAEADVQVKPTPCQMYSTYTVFVW